MFKYNLLHVPILSAYIQASSTVYINKYPYIHCHTSLKPYVFITCIGIVNSNIFQILINIGKILLWFWFEMISFLPWFGTEPRVSS